MRCEICELREQVKVLTAERDDARSGNIVTWRDRAKRAEAERDSAIRERDELQRLADRTRHLAEVNGAR